MEHSVCAATMLAGWPSGWLVGHLSSPPPPPFPFPNTSSLLEENITHHVVEQVSCSAPEFAENNSAVSAGARRREHGTGRHAVWSTVRCVPC